MAGADRVPPTRKSLSKDVGKDYRQSLEGGEINCYLWNPERYFNAAGDRRGES
jgi:hypothetical protein